MSGGVAMSDDIETLAEIVVLPETNWFRNLYTRCHTLLDRLYNRHQVSNLRTFDHHRDDLLELEHMKQRQRHEDEMFRRNLSAKTLKVIG